MTHRSADRSSFLTVPWEQPQGQKKWKRRGPGRDSDPADLRRELSSGTRVAPRPPESVSSGLKTHYELSGINQAVRSSDWPKTASVKEQAALGGKAPSSHRAAGLFPCTSQEAGRDNTPKADHAKEAAFSPRSDGA